MTFNFRPCCSAVAAFILCFLFTAPLKAQTGANTGLRGAVTDSSGATVPGATVTVNRIETGEERTLATDELGRWEARFISPGTYHLTIEKAGFKKLIRTGVSVTTAEITRVDAQLEVGDVGQSVEVVAEAGMISVNATSIRTLDRHELESLPTSARNFTQLLVIEPGVSSDISELLSNDNASISPSVNGARTT